MSAFCITFLYISTMQVSFIIADKSVKLCPSVDYIEVLNGNKAALQYNRFNPLYRLNIGCNYAALDSISSRAFLSLIKGDSLHLQYIDSSIVYLNEAYMMFPEEPVFALNYALAELFQGNSGNMV